MGKEKLIGKKKPQNEEKKESVDAPIEPYKAAVDPLDEVRKQEKVLYQFQTDSKSLRVFNAFLLCAVCLPISGGLFALCVLSVPLGVVLGLMPLFIGAMLFVVMYSNYCTYTVTDRRVIIKNRTVNRSISLDELQSVTRKRALFGGGRLVESVKIYTEKEGKLKPWGTMRCVFHVKECYNFLSECAANNKKKA